MNSNEKYFVSLISSYLNNISPVAEENIDWQEIYRLSNIHNVCAITANQIMMLESKNQPEKNLLSKFRQKLGYTLIDSDSKTIAINDIKKMLTDAGIDFLLIKGAILRNYYPVKEFRTSGDIDIIIKYADIDRFRQIIISSNININDDSDNGFAFDYDKQHIEIHSTEDYDHPYFKNIFDMCTNNGYEYFIDDEQHLLYILCHIIKHFNLCGAGIKMFMDIDVIIRHIADFDYDKFMRKCAELHIETFAKASFSLCHYWFNTPIKSEINFDKNEKFRKLFEDEIISSGSFGFNKRNLGDYYINKGIGKDGRNNFSAKLRALLALLFPSKRYLQNQCPYAKKHPILLPVAWLNRLFNAVFKRKAHSKSTIKSIMNTNKESEQYKRLLNELNI